MRKHTAIAKSAIDKGFCPNALNRKHKWLVKQGKNKDKPDQCILCNRLKVDIYGK